MPSTLVHVALAGLLAAALVPDDYFDRRAVLLVLAVAVVPDLDVFFGSLIRGAHRSLGHNLLLPGLAAALLAADLRVRSRSTVRRVLGAGGGWTAAVAIVGFVVAGIGLDYVVNGANLLWPVHDQFYTANGRAILSNQRGFVQTFVDLSPEPPSDGGGSGSGGGGSQPKTTDNTHYSTGVDPTAGSEPENVERVFPLVRSGWQLLLVVAGATVVSTKLWLAGGE